MKYKSSLTNEIKWTIIILVCFWAINVWYGYGHNSIKALAVMSIWILSFSVVFVLVLVKGIYIAIENNRVRYVHMFVLRRGVEIGKINQIQKGSLSGVFTSLLLTYVENGEVQSIKISPITFKKDTLKQFVSDLRKQNPQIDLDQSATELLS